jgi:hypothetical protein
MEAILRLQCDDVLGGRIERETPIGLVTVATVSRDGEGLVVHLTDRQVGAGLDYLEGLRARDCNDLQHRLARSDVTVTMPEV